MISLFQFWDPSVAGPYMDTAVLVAVYFLLERRIRRVENALNRVIGEVEHQK